MFISRAYAAASEAVDTAVNNSSHAVVVGPSPAQAFMWNMGLVLVLVVLFYFLLIRPQQRRFKEHSVMLAGLQKGDRIVTAGGIVGTIEKIVDDQEVVLDLGNGIKVTALRSTIQNHNKKPGKPANDTKTDEKK